MQIGMMEGVLVICSYETATYPVKVLWIPEILFLREAIVSTLSCKPLI